MNDYIVRASAAHTQIRAFAAVTTDLVEEARRRHGTSPVATAALGRLLTGGVLMGSMMKNETDVLTIQIKCSGPIQGLTVTADSQGNAKGYVFDPGVMLPPKNGKLDVGGALGLGILNVIKDMGLKEPYVGQTILQTGEIGDDLTYYFANSEQVPSSVGLGVLMEKDNTVKCAGGFIVQVMPFVEEKVLEQLGGEREEVNLFTSPCAPLDKERLERRDELLKNREYSVTEFALARQFAMADEIVLAAPYWDLLFPAAVRAYFENVTITGITFKYSKEGVPIGLCRAKRLIYVTTAGGSVGKNLGYEYVKELSEGLFKIPNVRCFKAEGLDIVGADIGAIMQKAIQEIDNANL